MLDGQPVDVKILALAETPSQWRARAMTPKRTKKPSFSDQIRAAVRESGVTPYRICADTGITVPVHPEQTTHSLPETAEISLKPVTSTSEVCFIPYRVFRSPSSEEEFSTRTRRSFIAGVQYH